VVENGRWNDDGAPCGVKRALAATLKGEKRAGRHGMEEDMLENQMAQQIHMWSFQVT
jgi:hypothetical protein